MSKQPSIRWRNKDVDELRRLIKSFNAKVTRTVKNHPELADIQPEKISKKSIMESIQTREDFNRIKENLGSYTKRGGEKEKKTEGGARTTRAGYFSAKRNLEAMNKKKSRERAEIEKKPVRHAGKQTGQTRASMGTIKGNDLKESKANLDKKNQKEFDKFVKAMDSYLSGRTTDRRKELYKENYLKILAVNGYSDELINIVKKLPDEFLLKVYQTDDAAEPEFPYTEDDRIRGEIAIRRAFMGGIKDHVRTKEEREKLKKLFKNDKQLRQNIGSDEFYLKAYNGEDD